ncbi:hypothetical protein QNH23_06490 [Siminovitchia fortis]|uniref:DNA-binding protein n=1 Tax=Siminovitchia fortis TaxID=254758 RepID=A0A443IMT5_9BACI|nr:DNA-binding protein [Siminovitchia fortis]RWR06753.1 DNA-binding protein [Siminovitchia fortis]WHY83020.1 hypothetical protein QNH23_06490 [Siminovitchia fortis]
MTISSDKTRTMLTLRKDLKEQAQERAKQENRSLNNLIETALIEYLNKSAK